MPVTDSITILAVADLGRAAALYEALLGAPRSVDTPVYVELPVSAGHRLGLYQREGFARNTGELPAAIAGIAPAELYLRCDDVMAAIEVLERCGARPLSPLGPRPWGYEAAYFADPDGFVVAVARRG